MTIYQDKLISLLEIILSQKVELGDNNSYVIKGIGNTSIKLESSDNVHLNNILYVSSLKNNLVCILFLEDKGDRVTFVDGKVLFWPKCSSIDFTKIIGVCEGRSNILLKQPTNEEILI